MRRLINLDCLDIPVELSDKLCDLNIEEFEYDLQYNYTAGTTATRHEPAYGAEVDALTNPVDAAEESLALIKHHLTDAEYNVLLNAIADHECEYYLTQDFVIAAGEYEAATEQEYQDLKADHYHDLRRDERDF